MKETIRVKQEDFIVDLAMDINMASVPDFNTKKLTQLFGVPEPETLNVMRHVLRPGDFAIDGGANIGFFSLLMAVLVGESGRVLAFEPGDDNIKKLQINAALNPELKKRLQIIQQPLWETQELVTLHYSPDPGQHSLAEHQTFGKKQLEATTIDAWHVKPRLIKLDIEGSEPAALIGAIATVTAYQPYIICELNETALNYFGKNGNKLRSYVKATFGYETFMLFKRQLYPAFLPLGVQIDTPHMNTNVLFATVDMVATAFPVMKYE